MAVRWKPWQRGQQDDELVMLKDIRELLFLMLHVQLAGPDPSGNLEPVKRRLERFIEQRMEEYD